MVKRLLFNVALLLFAPIFVLSVQGGSAVSAASTATPAIIQITKVSQDEPVLSPDGKKILFQSDVNGPSNLYVMDPDGRHVTRLTNHAGEDDGGIWSPDGKLIAFSSQDHTTGISEIYVITAEGKGKGN